MRIGIRWEGYSAMEFPYLRRNGGFMPNMAACKMEHFPCFAVAAAAAPRSLAVLACCLLLLPL